MPPTANKKPCGVPMPRSRYVFDTAQATQAAWEKEAKSENKEETVGL